MKRFFAVTLVLLCALSSHSLYAAEQNDRAGCTVCGMYLDVYQKTAAQGQLSGKGATHTCGVVCLLRVVQDAGGPEAFSAIKVRDWHNGRLVAAKDATYVIGSDVIPDMLPSLIAFADKVEAEAFRAAQGGEILDFNLALNAISPMGMTMPTKIKAAVLPPQGAFGIGLGYMYMSMDTVKLGSSSVEPENFIKRPGQMMGPKKMESSGEMLMANYGLSDDLTLSLSAKYLERKMQMYTMGGNAITTSKHTGLSDLSLGLRYNMWHNTHYSRFFTLLAETTLPSGDFEMEWLNSPGMQLGTGDFTFTGGLLYSQRYKNIWFHGLTSYTTKRENSDDYKFGDEAKIGAALHYTPNYDLMLGLEIDGVHYEKNEYQGNEIGNTGGFRSNLSGVIDWRFLTALGGNFSLRTSAGLPIYEDLNHAKSGMVESVQLGGGYFVNVSINFKRRYSDS